MINEIDNGHKKFVRLKFKREGNREEKITLVSNKLSRDTFPGAGFLRASSSTNPNSHSYSYSYPHTNPDTQTYTNSDTGGARDGEGDTDQV